MWIVDADVDTDRGGMGFLPYSCDKNFKTKQKKIVHQRCQSSAMNVFPSTFNPGRYNTIHVIHMSRI